jgi:hypothetical protein
MPYAPLAAGPLKNALDWGSRPPNCWGHRAAAVLSSSGGTGGTRSQYHIRQVGVFLDIHFLNKPRKCGVDSGTHGPLNPPPPSRVELCAVAGPDQLDGLYLEPYLTPSYSASEQKLHLALSFPPPRACCTLAPPPVML